MTSQEFFLIPKENGVKEQPKTLELLDDATINEKAKINTLLQRQQKFSETVEPNEKMDINLSRAHCRKKSSRKEC